MTRLARESPVFLLVLAALLAVLAYGTARRLTAHAANPPPATVPAARALADDPGQVSLHVADADADVGPGNAEPVLARHPGP
jgi:hypothetical protein